MKSLMAFLLVIFFMNCALADVQTVPSKTLEFDQLECGLYKLRGHLHSKQIDKTAPEDYYLTIFPYPKGNRKKRDLLLTTPTMTTITQSDVYHDMDVELIASIGLRSKLDNQIKLINIIGPIAPGALEPIEDQIKLEKIQPCDTDDATTSKDRP